MKRNTRQRHVIIEALKELNHPTAYEVYDFIRPLMPNISLGTVYRNLEELYKTGTIQKIETDDQKQFDLEIKRHHHIRCTECKHLFNIPYDVMEKMSFTLPNIPGFMVQDCILEFRGICSKCSRKEILTEKRSLESLLDEIRQRVQGKELSKIEEILQGKEEVMEDCK